MERVTGIGGIFFRARDPKALAEWYERHLGITRTPKGPDDVPWRQEAGDTVFEPFKQDSTYFDAAKQWMINFRVRNLDAMVAQLRGAGIEVTEPEGMAGVGRFARTHDPEKNAIELWEPEQQG